MVVVSLVVPLTPRNSNFPTNLLVGLFRAARGPSRIALDATSAQAAAQKISRTTIAGDLRQPSEASITLVPALVPAACSLTPRTLSIP